MLEKSIKILTVIGARPQFIKAATVSRAIKKHNEKHNYKIVEIIAHTGQHYDANMSDIFFEEMDIPLPNYTLGVGGGTHGMMTGQQLEKIEQILFQEKPDYVLVYGDTNSTLAGALAAIKLHIPIIHVEAGLRSFNMGMPEEVNRILTDQVSEFLFCPTETAINNLNKEGFTNKNCKIVNVGDVMYDAAMHYVGKAKKPGSLIFNGKADFILSTIHRAENTDDSANLQKIVDSLNELHKNTTVICPVHPRTRKLIQELQLKINFIILEPVGYFEMIWLLQRCSVVITDSGGLQKEAYFFGKPCVTLRDQTEWVELIEAGVNQLASIEKSDIISKYEYAKKVSPKLFVNRNIYGNGNASEKIVDYIFTHLKRPCDH